MISGLVCNWFIIRLSNHDASMSGHLPINSMIEKVVDSEIKMSWLIAIFNLLQSFLHLRILYFIASDASNCKNRMLVNISNSLIHKIVCFISLMLLLLLMNCMVAESKPWLFGFKFVNSVLFTIIIVTRLAIFSLSFNQSRLIFFTLIFFMSTAFYYARNLSVLSTWINNKSTCNNKMYDDSV